MSKRNTPIKTTVADAVSCAYETMRELCDEGMEVLDSMSSSEGLMQTERYSNWDDTVSQLDGVEELDVPECVAELEVACTIDMRKRESSTRNGRRQNALAYASAAAAAIGACVEEENSIAFPPDETLVEAGGFLDSLDEAISIWENVDFPGIYG